MFENIRIVLVETTHPGNIGAVARAMKTMGLERLYLVNPLHFPHVKATARASGATSVLEVARVIRTFKEAVADCALVIGTSARLRHLSWPLLSPKEAGEKLSEMAVEGSQVAVVFGREHSGLTNEELQQCHYHVQIPTDSQFSSLNIAAAVQVLCYEIRLATLVAEEKNMKQPSNKEGDEAVSLATHQEMEKFYNHLVTVLEQIQFLNPENPRQLMSRLRRLYSRAGIDSVELNILRGILTATQKKLPVN